MYRFCGVQILYVAKSVWTPRLYLTVAARAALTCRSFCHMLNLQQGFDLMQTPEHHPGPTGMMLIRSGPESGFRFLHTPFLYGVEFVYRLQLNKTPPGVQHMKCSSLWTVDANRS